MNRFGKRARVLSGMGVIAVPLVAAAVAYGCTAAATLSSSPGGASPGSTVTITGKYFKTHTTDSPGSAGPIEIRLGSITGPALAKVEGISGPDRDFTVQVRLPSNATVGDTFISATQFESDGRPVYGTPARQAFTVTPPPPPPPPPAAGSGAAGGGQVGNTVARRPLATLSLASASRRARAQVKRRNRRAKSIRATCVRRSRTSAVCRVRYRVGSKRLSRKLVIRSQSRASAAAAW